MPATATTTRRLLRVRVKRPMTARRDWPRSLPCLRCDRPRLATGPGDRLHPKCRAED